MSESKKGKVEVQKQENTKQKTCFAIMPIADHPDYPPGHFTRVYNHLIKPACEKAGYKVIRADDAKASHMIMFDILKNIVECDMAICDLSSKNANVFYELGLRQAYNKKTILITDSITNTPFDITGFRYVKYSESLRVDTVMSDIAEITAMLEETESANEDDINSIVNLLKIQPAHINKVELNEQESVVYELIKNLDAKVSSLTNSNKENTRWAYTSSTSPSRFKSHTKPPYSGLTFDEVKSLFPEDLNQVMFRDGAMTIGKYIGKTEEGDLMFMNNRSLFTCNDNEFDRSTLQVI